MFSLFKEDSQGKTQNLQKLDLSVSVAGLITTPQSLSSALCAVMSMPERVSPQPQTSFGPVCEARPGYSVGTLDRFKEGTTSLKPSRELMPESFLATKHLLWYNEVPALLQEGKPFPLRPPVQL